MTPLTNTKVLNTINTTNCIDHRAFNPFRTYSNYIAMASANKEKSMIVQRDSNTQV